MTWLELEKMFNRSVAYAFSKKKLLLVFPILALCGLISVICRTLSHTSGKWIQMSLAFLPIFISASLLLGLGLVLVRIYHAEVKGIFFEYSTLVKRSKDLFLAIPYLAVPLIFAYLLLWSVVGIFFLVKALPGIRPFMSALLSFGPFLLVLASLLLGVISLLTLFYLTPAAALKSELNRQLAQEVLLHLKKNPFRSVTLLVMGLIPTFLIVGLLSLAAVVTQILYVEGVHPVTIALKWFLTMLPFCAFLTPTVIFFFNFSAESHVLFLRKSKKEIPELIEERRYQKNLKAREGEKENPQHYYSQSATNSKNQERSGQNNSEENQTKPFFG